MSSQNFDIRIFQLRNGRYPVEVSASDGVMRMAKIIPFLTGRMTVVKS